VEGSNGRESGELGMVGGMVLRAGKAKGDPVEAAPLLPGPPFLVKAHQNQADMHAVMSRLHSALM
jgi:hypothetical protein